jgi:hypothetical protein
LSAAPLAAGAALMVLLLIIGASLIAFRVRGDRGDPK